MKRTLVRVLLLLMLPLSVAAAQEGLEFAEGDIGLGLKFYTSREAVEEDFPDFAAEDRPGFPGVFAAGNCAILGREARLTCSTSGDYPMAVAVAARFTADKQGAEALFGQVYEEVRGIWGDGTERKMADPDDEGSYLSLPDVLDMEMGGGYLRFWDRGRYYADLTIRNMGASKYDITVKMIDFQALAGILPPLAYKPDTVFFRNTKWRMTEEEVRASEPDVPFAAPVASHYANEYSVKSVDPVEMYGGADAEIYYTFRAYSLSQARVILLLPFEDLEDTYKQYEAIRSQFGRQFGASDISVPLPTLAEALRRYERVKNAPSRREQLETGNYVREEDIQSYETFTAGDTKIVLRMKFGYGEEDRWMSVEYYDQTRWS